MTLEPLEKAVLQKLLEGDHPVLTALRHQMSELSVKTRERTGAGFFTEFSMPRTAHPARMRSVKASFGDVEATISGLKHGSGFVLYIENGLLHMLEGYSYEEPWPEQVLDFSVRHSNPDRADVLARLNAA